MKPTKRRKKLNPSKSNTGSMNKVQKAHELWRRAFNKSYFGNKYTNNWKYDKEEYYL